MKRTDNFHKFVKQPKGSAIKEQIKQEKKKAKKERAEAIDRHYAKKREERDLQRASQNANRPSTNNAANSRAEAPKKSYSKRAASAKTFKGNKPPFKRTEEVDTNRPSFNNRPIEAAPKYNKPKTAKDFQSPKKSFNNKEEVQSSKKYLKNKEDDQPTKRSSNNKDVDQPSKQHKENKPYNKELKSKTEAGGKKPHIFENKHSKSNNDDKVTANKHQAVASKNNKGTKPEKTVSKASDYSNDVMPLNKYIAHSGICSRRDAAILVKDGKVTVNGKVVSDPGTKVSSNDTINVSNQKVTPSKNFVYILLNKPKDYITTLEDPQGRRTVLELVRQATNERIYPIGRLDRNTSGVLLLTNDGDLAQKLSHPKHEIKKVYEVKLDRNLTKGDMDKIAEGITLEDGLIAPDVIAYADSKDKSIIGIEIHSGRNRIVRRIFEHMKYDVRGLDRVMYAGLTKKNVQRGNWRFLTEKEVRILKFMNQSYVKGKAE